MSPRPLINITLLENFVFIQCLIGSGAGEFGRSKMVAPENLVCALRHCGHSPSHGKRSFKIMDRTRVPLWKTYRRSSHCSLQMSELSLQGWDSCQPGWGTGAHEVGVFPPPQCGLLDITKDRASWSVVEGKMLRKASLLAYYAILRKEAQARSIHPLCRRQTACDVGSSGLFLVRIFQSYEFDMTLAWCPDRTQCRHNSIFL